MYFKIPFISNNRLKNTIKLALLLGSGLFLLDACLSPQDTPAPPVAKIERNYLLPLWADGQIVGVDIYHPDHSTVLETADNLQVYQIAPYSVITDNQPTKLYYPYLVYLKGNYIYFKDLWPTNSHDPFFVASIPVNGDGTSFPYCKFNIRGGSSKDDINNGGVIRYVIPNASGVCDDYRVFNSSEPSYDRTADYPLNNLTYEIGIVDITGAGPQLLPTTGDTYFNNYFAILPNTQRPTGTEAKTLGRLIADQAPGNILWFNGDIQVSESDINPPAAANLIKTNVANFSYRTIAGLHLIVFLIDGKVFAFKTDDPDLTTALDDTKAVHTLSAGANPDYGNFFIANNNRMFFFDDKKVLFIDISGTQGLYPVTPLIDLTATGAASLAFANVSNNYFYIKEVIDPNNYNLVAIDQTGGSGQRHFLAQLDVNASISLFYDHYYINDAVKGINGVFDATLDYSDGVTNQYVSLPPNLQFATFVYNNFTPNDPGPIHLLLKEDKGGNSYGLYYYALDSGSSVYLGDMTFPSGSTAPNFYADIIDDNMILIKTEINNQLNGVAVSHINRENDLVRLLPNNTQVWSMR